MHVFVSTKLIRAAEAMTTAKGNAPGRPTSHSTCLILAMLAIKSILGVGYRETDRFFREAGYMNLPDFRTIHWRAERLRRKNLHINTSISGGKYENTVLLDVSDGRKFVSVKEIDGRAWSRAIRRIGRNFVELMV